MSYVFRFVRSCTIVSLMCLLSGCIVSDQTTVKFDIDADLSGTVTIGVTGIHSNDKDSEKQEKEFKEYCEKKYLEQGKSLAKVFGIADPQITLTNRTDTRCELLVEGAFDKLALVLAGMVNDKDYEIRKSGQFFIARFFMENEQKAETDEDTNEETDKDTKDDFVIVVQYAGETQDNNAHQTDPETGAMIWFDSSMDESGVQFILKIPESD